MKLNNINDTIIKGYDDTKGKKRNMEYAAVIAKVILTPVEMHQKSFVVIKDNGKKKDTITLCVNNLQVSQIMI